MTAATPPQSEPARIPWPMAAAAVVAFAALFVTSRGILLPFFAVAIIASYFTPARLESRTLWVWMLRLGLMGITFLVISTGGEMAADGLVNPSISSLTGQLFATEAVVQMWLRKPDVRGISVLLLSGLIFTTACNTFEVAYIRFFAPVYLFFVVLAIERFRPRGALNAVSTRTPVLQRVGWAALAWAFLVGSGLYLGLFAYRAQITEWSNNLILQQRPMVLTGMATDPQLGGSYDLQKSPTRVLSIQGLQGEAHLRGAAYDTYQHGGWKPSLRDLRFQDAMGEIDRHKAGKVARVIRYSDDNRLMFLPLNAMAVATSGADFDWAADYGVVRGGKAGGGTLTYDIVLGPGEEYQGPLCRPVKGTGLDRCREVPPGTTQWVRELAQHIAGKAEGPRAKIQAVVDYLDANHQYSLRIRATPGIDPVEDFLRNKKAAHCQYFASSAAILLRCMGVPSRYVNGYYAHEESSPGTITVRQWDAHAWTECWIEGTGWVTVDATPGNGRPDRLFGEPPAWTRGLEWLQDCYRLFSGWIAEFGKPQVVGIGVILAVGVLGFIAFRNRPRRLLPAAAGAAYTTAAADLVALAGRFEDVLQRAGVPCPPPLTWAEYLDQLLRERPLPFDAAAARAFIRAYNAARFGSGSVETAATHLEMLEGGLGEGTADGRR